MRPNSTSTVIRSDLGALLYEYFHNPDDFVMGKVLPVFRSNVQNGQYPVIPREMFIKIPENISRAARAAYYRDEGSFEMKDFATADRGVEVLLDDSERAMYGNLFSAEIPLTQRLASIMLRTHEIKGAELLTNTSTFSNDVASAAWNQKADCDPRVDVIARKRAIRDNTGIVADTVVMSKTSLDNVLESAAFIDQCKYTMTPLLLSESEQIALVAKFFGVDKLYIVNGVKDVSKKPTTLTVSDIWPSSKVLVCKTASNPNDLKEPCVGRTFLYVEDSPDIITMEQYRDDQHRSDVYRLRANMIEKLVCTDLGSLITNTHS